MKELDLLHSNLEKSLEAFRKELYSPYEPKITQLEPVDVDARGQVSQHGPAQGAVEPRPPVEPIIQVPSSQQQPSAITDARQTALPPMGPAVHSPLQLGQKVYAMRSNLLSPWAVATVVRVWCKNPQE